RTSCGCFGRLTVNPWYTFGFDLAILAALAVARPSLNPLRKQPRAAMKHGLRLAAAALAGIILIIGIVIGVAHVSFGSLRAALAHFRGERVSVEPRLLDVGEAFHGES